MVKMSTRGFSIEMQLFTAREWRRIGGVDDDDKLVDEYRNVNSG